MLSLQLATCTFYRDFLLLDPCDAGAVYKFLETNGGGEEQTAFHRASSVRSKSKHINFASPNGRFGATPRRSSLGKKQAITQNGVSESNHAFEDNSDNIWSEPASNHDYPADDTCLGEEPNFGVSNDGDDSESDSDDCWKPLNPHEPGNLKIKPFKASMFFLF